MANIPANKKPVLGELRLHNVRLSFPHLFVPQPGIRDEKTGITSEPRWSACFLIEKTNKVELRKYAAARDEAKAAKWGDEKNWPKLKPERLCMRDGDLENYDGYAGHYYIASGRSTKTKDGAENPPPSLVDRDPKVRLTRQSGKLYAGCFVNALVRVWAQDDSKFGKRLNCSLEAVQFYDHGTPFGAMPVVPEEVFEDYSDVFAEDISAEDFDNEDLVG